MVNVSRPMLDSFVRLICFNHVCSSRSADKHVTSCLVGIAGIENADLSPEPTSETFVKDFVSGAIHSMS